MIPRETKVMLPNKKPLKWSTGVAPGDYGGPPTSTKLRKYWGGEEEDPLTSDDFIWNKDFMPRMKKLIQEPSPPATPLKEQEASGFLSINRVMSHEPDNQQDFKKMEQENIWQGAKAASGGTDFMLREVRQPQGDPRLLAAESRKKYYKLKKKLQIYTLGVGGVGLVSSYISYSPEVAASFGAGFLVSLVYIRMLGSSVDSLADGARGLMKGAIAQPRLLVPVALVMIFNRWNQILVPQFGVVHLELIPILLGFFTYKMATFIQAIEEAVSVVESKS